MRKERMEDIISLFHSVLSYLKNLYETINAIFTVKKRYLLAIPTSQLKCQLPVS